MKKMIFIVSVVIVATVVVIVFSMMNRDRKSSSYEVSNGNLVISGSFGVTVPLSEISDLKMADTMPSITTKTNGAWIGNSCKGEFILEDNIKARLYVHTDAPPFITFVQGAVVFYINTETPADTQSLYDLLNTIVS